MVTIQSKNQIKGIYAGGFDSPFRFKNTTEAIGAKTRSGDYENLPTYPRSGSEQLFKLERLAERLVNANGSYFFCVNSGMSAVIQLIETTAPTKGDVILHTPKIYGRTAAYFNDLLGKRGVRVVKLDLVQPQAVEEQIRFVVNKNRGSNIKAIWIEVLGNGLGMPVTDPEAILDLKIWTEFEELKNTRIFFDNTLPTNTVIPIPKYLKARPKVKAAQGDSTTKFIEKNQALGGFLISYNDEIGKELWLYRTILGYTPDAKAALSSQEAICEGQGNFDAIKARFDSYILTAMASTARLAEAIQEVAGDRLVVSYPGLENHPDHKLAKKWHPKGSISPVIFIAPVTGDSLKVEDLYQKLEKYGGLREIQHTDSFGFKRAGVYYNNTDPSIRLAGGQETLKIVKRQTEQLQKAIIKILKS